MKEDIVRPRLAFRVTHGVVHILLTVAFYCFAAFVVVKACSFAYHFSYEIFGHVTVTDSAHKYDRQVVINENEGTMSVAKKLELYKVIKNKYSFYVRAKIGDERIKPGTYILSSNMDYEQILDVITHMSEKSVATP